MSDELLGQNPMVRAWARAAAVGCYIDEIPEAERSPEDTGPYLLRCLISHLDLHPEAVPIAEILRIIECVARERAGLHVPLDEWEARR